MYFIVWGHCRFIPEILNTVIYSFHVGAFFVLSGFLHKDIYLNKIYILKIVRSLLLPILILNVLIYPLFLVYLRTYTFEDLIIKPLLGLLFFKNTYATPIVTTGWFVMVLFIIKFCAPYFSSLKNVTIFITIMINIVIAYYLTSNLNQGLFLIEKSFLFMPFFLMGLLLKRRFSFFERRSLAVFTISSILFLLATYLNGMIDLWQGVYKSLLGAYISGVSGFLILMYIFKYFAKNSYICILNISVGTLIIMAYHKYLLRILGWFYEKIPFLPEYGLLKSVLLTTITIILCYQIIIFCLKHFPVVVGKEIKYV